MAGLTPPQTPTLQAQLPGQWSLADLQQYLGGIPLERVRLFPPPGYATEEDVVRIKAREGRLCELEKGILVEKPMGWYESILAMLVGTEIGIYLKSHDLGQTLGADGMLKLLPGVVKIPDVSFISWKRFPQQELPRSPIPALVPDLVVEILSEANTEAEMMDKLEKYFQSGVRLVWYFDPASRSVRVFHGPRDVAHVDAQGVLDGQDILPGFQLLVGELYERADRQGPRPASPA
jgi:Uma2 family endonuclease